MKRRWPALLGAQLALTVVAFVAFVAIVESGETALRMFGDSETWIALLVIFGGVSVAQAILLSPVLRRRPRRARGGSVWASLGLGATLVAAMCGSFALAIGQAFTDLKAVGDGLLITALAVTATAWLGGAVAFVNYTRARPDVSREGLLQLLSTRLLQATVFESIANIPLDMIIREKSSCRCAHASILVWAVCFAVGLVVFGPAVLLTVLRKERAVWYRDHCDTCGARRGDVMTEVAYREAPAVVCAQCGNIGGIVR